MSKAESLFQQGCESYNTNRLRAASLFAAALAEDPNHQGALIMSSLCESLPEKQQSFLERAIAVNGDSADGQRAQKMLARLIARLDSMNPLNQIDGASSPPPTQNQNGSLPPTENPSNDEPSHQDEANPELQRIKPGDLLSNRYKIVEYRGAGGYGTSFLANDLKLSQECIVKQLIARPGAKELLDREVTMLVALNKPGHEGIPPIYDYLPVEQCIVMKVIDGVTLDKMVEKKPLPEGLTLRFLRDAASALDYMHHHEEELGKKVPKLHRDPTPRNMMRDRRNHFWLIDYGLANVAADANDNDGAGTPAFIAPEQLRGQSEPRSDIFTLGKSFEFLINPQGKPIKLNPRLKRLLERMTHRSPAERPSAGWIVETLDHLLALRLARRLVMGLLLLVVLSLLSNLAMFMPRINLPRQVQAIRGELTTTQSQLTTVNRQLTAANQQLTTANQQLADVKTQTNQAQATLENVQSNVRREEARLEELRKVRNIPFPATPITLVGGIGRSSGVLSTDTMTQFYTFELQEASRVVIEAKSPPRTSDGRSQGLRDPVIFLYNSSGQLIGYNDDIDTANDNLDARINTLRALPSGIYTVQVTSYKYDGSSSPSLGRYTIEVRS